VARSNGARGKDLQAPKKASVPNNKKEERPAPTQNNTQAATNNTNAVPPQPQPAPPKKEVKSWSDLFAKEKAASQAAEERAQNMQILAAITLKEALDKNQVSTAPIYFVPRGLNNKDTKCFLNVSVQSLMACQPFVRWLASLDNVNITPNEFPALGRVVQFFREFERVEPKPKPAVGASNAKGTTVNKNANNNGPSSEEMIKLGFAFTPDYLHELLSTFNPIASDFQEDTQEFMIFLLDMLHSELIRAVGPTKKTITISQPTHDEEDEWEEVGKKNKSAVVITKADTFDESKISELFSGKMRSIVNKKGQKSSASIQPFYCLHLDIEFPQIVTVEDALDFLMTKERLDDFHDSKNKTEIRASKQMSIEVLPPVLILHLKRFSFGLQGAEKVQKSLSYPLSLKIRPAWLASEKKYTAQQRTYSLVAVVSHLGQEVAGGHYTCDIRQANGQWLYFDDHRVTRSSPESVTNRKAYILVYQMSTYDD
jgi:ubiquitin carboxyl-terminal hydrolase 10